MSLWMDVTSEPSFSPMHNSRFFLRHLPRRELSDAPNSAPATPSTTDTEEVVEVRVKVLTRGAKGEQVKSLQTFLCGCGYDLGRTGIDGDFGPITESCVRKYQSRNSLEIDGKVGPKTWAKLLGLGG